MSTTPTTERPLLMRPELAAATARGHKTQTRRLTGLTAINERSGDYYSGPTVHEAQGATYAVFTPRDGSEKVSVKCPYGIVGDKIWIREKWQAFYPDTDEPLVGPAPKEQGGLALSYAGYEPERVAAGYAPYTGKWRPSIHQPRWASRLLLELTGIRCERAGCISDADALDEGVEPTSELTSAEAFAQLWTDINGADTWTHFVWVLEFRLLCCDTPTLLPAAPLAEPITLYPTINYLEGDRRPVEQLLNEAYEKGLGDLTQALSSQPRPTPYGRRPPTCINDLPAGFVHVFNLIVLARTVDISLPHFTEQLSRDERRLLHGFTAHLHTFLSNALRVLTDRGCLKPRLGQDGKPRETPLEAARHFSYEMADLVYESLYQLNQAPDPREPYAAMQLFNQYGLVQEVPTEDNTLTTESTQPVSSPAA